MSEGSPSGRVGAADQPPPPTVFAGDHLLTMLAVGYLLALLTSSVLASMAAGVGASPTGTFAAGAVGLWIGLLVTAQRIAGNPVRDLRALAARLRLGFGWRDVALGAPAGIATQLVVIPVLYVPIARLWSINVSEAARQRVDEAAGGWFALFVAVVVVGAPLFEEVFFRGALLGVLRQRFGSLAGVAVSTLVFGGTHFQIVQLPGLAAAGLVFAVLAYRTGRLGPAVWAHVAFNATTVVAFAHG